jgi:cyclopropane fatty-acyl-phospholipid synthase-like methyltransferase
VVTRSEAEAVDRFSDRYRGCCAPVRLDIERAVLEGDYGSTGYTTRKQADDLARHLKLQRGDRLADIGSGSGWPGLYLARTTGCVVTGTDLPLEGLRNARDRARRDGLDGRATYAMATGPRQPLRRGAFDAVVHTDVLCCLGPKLALLRACRTLLRPGGRMAYTTIYVAPGLERSDHRRAVSAGPWQVSARRPYGEMTEQAGFTGIVEIDVTDEYATTQQAWFDAHEARADDVRTLSSEEDFALAQADRRRALDAIRRGWLRRCIIVATRGAPGAR